MKIYLCQLNIEYKFDTFSTRHKLLLSLYCSVKENINIVYFIKFNIKLLDLFGKIIILFTCHNKDY